MSHHDQATASVSGPVRAVGYIRVSSGEQARVGLSLPAQRQAIEDTCRAHGFELVDVYDDAGRSGKTEKNRPGYLAALDDMRHGRADVLVVVRTDRMSRR